MKRLRPMVLGMILAMASTPGFAQQPAHQPPTATELFVERLSACAQLAKKILDTRGGHGADWGDPTLSLRYDPATDHCYLEMTIVSPRDTTLWGGHFLEQLATTTVYTTLWDAQTQELLATTTISQNGRFGTVFANDPNYKPRLPSADNGYGFDDANDYINRVMYENRGGSPYQGSKL